MSARSFLSFLVVASLVLAGWASPVVTLTSETFEHQTQASTGQTTGKWFVKFYAPWCGHCKKLAPIWDGLAEDLAADVETQDLGIVIAKVDCTTSGDVCKRFSVAGYPTLKYIAEGKVYQYKGPRTLEDLKAFVTADYKDQASEDVPLPPSWLETTLSQHKVLLDLKEDFIHIVDKRKNAAAVLIVVGVISGVLLMNVVGMVFGGKKTKPKSD